MKAKRITADLKCMSCGRIWGTAQDDATAAFSTGALRSSNPDVLPELNIKTRRCPRCHGTLWLEQIEPVEYETDLLLGA